MAVQGRKVTAATGGLALDRWRAACRRRRPLTVAEAKLRARALRARPAVERVLAEQAKALAEQGAALAQARGGLKAAAGRLARFGHLGARAVGANFLDQLCRFAEPGGGSSPEA